jgi:hypothetical protein
MTAPPSSTALRRSWSNGIANGNKIKNNQIALALKGKRIERLESYVCELERKLCNEQKAKAKLKVQVDHFKGVSILDPNRPKVPVDHKDDFETELRDFMKDTHKRLALSTKATICGKVLQDREFMDGFLFKEAISLIRKFYHDTIFQTIRY